jgi:hypothetical protein
MNAPAAASRSGLIGLVSQLFELEAIIHREAYRRAERGADPLRGAAALDLRALVVQSSQSLDDLRVLADRRGDSIVSLATLWRDAIRSIQHLAPPRPADTDLGVLVGALRSGLAIARRLELAAEEDDARDPVLAAFCRRWIATREPLVSSLASVADAIAARPTPRPPAVGRRGRRRRSPSASGPPTSVRFEAPPSSARW